MSPERFNVTILDKEIISDFAVDSDGGDELSRMIMASIRQNRREVDEIRLKRKFDRYGRRRRSSEIRNISEDAQKKLDGLRKELQALRGEIQVPLSIIRDFEGNLLGLEVESGNNMNPRKLTSEVV